jgi:hypothetical protein
VPSKQTQAALDVYLLDLSSTLRQSERAAESIERQITSFKRPSPDPAAPLDSETVAGVVSVSFALVAETRTLVENVREGRALLRQLQAECKKLRRGD